MVLMTVWLSILVEIHNRCLVAPLTTTFCLSLLCNSMGFEFICQVNNSKTVDATRL